MSLLCLHRPWTVYGWGGTEGGWTAFTHSSREKRHLPASQCGRLWTFFCSETDRGPERHPYHHGKAYQRGIRQRYGSCQVLWKRNGAGFRPSVQQHGPGSPLRGFYGGKPCYKDGYCQCRKEIEALHFFRVYHWQHPYDVSGRPYPKTYWGDLRRPASASHHCPPQQQNGG